MADSLSGFAGPHSTRSGVNLSWELPHQLTHSSQETQRFADVRAHLEICVQTLRELEKDAPSPHGCESPPARHVSPITIRMLAACLSELLKLESTQPHRSSCHDLCKLLDCPQQPILREAICHTVEVLEETKCRFKSKELKQLRESLEALLANSRDFAPSPLS